ncbi:MAG: zinc-binding dehydrogenase [Defluviitaleaceae bacterium]|nr:zinc-binding dehydrogenase [Defluviitaleaceae bacterium]
MEINTVNIEKIVKQVLNEMAAPTLPHSQPTPQTGRVAMLTAKEQFEIQHYPIPTPGDDEILVKIEGCGVCGTDAHEYLKDPFNLIPVVLGHEGSGTVVQIGKNVKCDSAGNPVKLGDKIVTSVMFDDDADIAMRDMNQLNLSDSSSVYGLLPDDNVHFNGWFADYLLVRGGSSFFVVNDLNLELRLLVEPAAVVIHAAEQAKKTNLLRFNSRVLVQGCGPIGLLLIAVLRTMGIHNIVAVDGEDKRLDFARELGATETVNIKRYNGPEAVLEAIKTATAGKLADFAFQCTGAPAAHAAVWKFIRRGGGLCELGFFVDNGEASINPHHDICKKEITVVGSWVYTLRDYATTFDFMKRAKAIGLPLEKLITHKFPLAQIDEALKVNLRMEGIKVAVINE